MILIIGLGNPGKKYQKTRHNIGFMIVESLKLKVKSFSDWKNNKKLLSEISEGEINGQKVILANPQTFMNLSGKAVRAIFNFFTPTPNFGVGARFSIFNQFSISKFSNKNLIVVHDDIDLPLGKIKISFGKSSAGHKGVESIITELETKNFIRFRIGICPKTGKPKNAESFVLKKFSREEEKIVQEVIEKTREAIEFYLEEGLEKTMSKYNL